MSPQDVALVKALENEANGRFHSRELDSLMLNAAARIAELEAVIKANDEKELERLGNPFDSPQFELYRKTELLTLLNERLGLARIERDEWHSKFAERAADNARLQKLLEVQAKVNRELNQMLVTLSTSKRVVLPTREAFAELLVEYGVVDTWAVESPEDHAQGETLSRIYKVHAVLCAREVARNAIEDYARFPKHKQPESP